MSVVDSSWDKPARICKAFLAVDSYECVSIQKFSRASLSHRLYPSKLTRKGTIYNITKARPLIPKGFLTLWRQEQSRVDALCVFLRRKPHENPVFMLHALFFTHSHDWGITSRWICPAILETGYGSVPGYTASVRYWQRKDCERQFEDNDCGGAI